MPRRRTFPYMQTHTQGEKLERREARYKLLRERVARIVGWKETKFFVTVGVGLFLSLPPHPR